MNRVTYFWRTREGGHCQVSVNVEQDFTPEQLAEARAWAIEQGYPGHEGGWWNYLVTDFHEWLARRGWTRCECHPHP
jgi:hypothetical protein